MILNPPNGGQGRLNCLHDCREILFFECSSTYEAAIHIGFRENFFCIRWLAASPIKNRQFLSTIIAIFLFNQIADIFVHLLCLIRCCSQPCTDCPYTVSYTHLTLPTKRIV